MFFRSVIIVVFSLNVLSPLFTKAQTSSLDLLVRQCPSREQLSNCLVQDLSWINIPDYHNREAWTSTPAKYRAEIVARGENLLNFKFASTPASYYLETARSGNRKLADDFNNEKYTAFKNLIMAELVEGKGRFLDKIIDGVFSICEMTSWSGTAHLNAQKAGLGLPDVEEPIVDLSVAEMGNMLSWCNHFFKSDFDKINPLISKRIIYEVKKNVINPYRSRMYSWMGLQGQKVNNWNIWINYNLLNYVLLIEENPDKRLETVYRTIASADKFINSINEDGGCEEGPVYWNHAGGKLYEYLDLLARATKNQISIFDHPKVKNIGSYIYKACIYYPYFINFSDAGPTQAPSPYIVYHFGKSTNDTTLQQFGNFLVNRHGWADRIWGGVYGVEKLSSNLFDYEKINAVKVQEPQGKPFWLQGSQIAAGRDLYDHGFAYAAKGGYNAASHGHNDIGSFILFYNKKPVFVDPGVGTYTIKTFSKDRYTIWSMQSGYHNSVTINGKDQKEGKEYVAQQCNFLDSEQKTSFSVDIAKAYESDAMINSWVRNYTINKGKNFTISDTYDLKDAKNKSYINLITPCEVDLSTKGKVTIKAAELNVAVIYNPKEMDALVEEINMSDPAFDKTWPSGLRRLRFKITSKKNKGNVTLTVLPNEFH